MSSTVGSIIYWPVAAVPAGWLACDGTSYLVAAQPDLFAVIGYTFGGAGPNFNVPDCRNRYVFGVGTALALAANDGLAVGARISNTHIHPGTAAVTGAAGAGVLPLAHTPASVDTDVGGGGFQVAAGITPVAADAHTHPIAAPAAHAAGAADHTHLRGATGAAANWPTRIFMQRIICAAVV